MKFCSDDINKILLIAKEKNVRLEGNILKIIEAEDNEEFAKYLTDSIELDNKNRKKRLAITKDIQSQNRQLKEKDQQNGDLMKELVDALQRAEENSKLVENKNRELVLWKEENEKLQLDLKAALTTAETSKKQVEEDLEFLQKKSQYELIGNIVKVALTVIIGVAIISTVMYVIAIVAGRETQIIGSTWSNMLGILLTNAFSIVGTITGVKYADNARLKSKEKD
jgi:maltodextrin utilization protein YvdJ